MYYNIIPLVLIIVSAVVILRIIIKKFPAVVNLDLASLPQEKEKRVKAHLIQARFRRGLNRWFLSARRVSQPLFAAVKEWGGAVWRKLLTARENLTHVSPERSGGGSDIAELFSQAAAAEKNDDAEAAEQCYIRIISLDSKNAAAFKMLGQFYFAQGKLAEARETLEHVLKLTREDSEIYAKIAEVAAKQADNDKAREYYQKSIKLNSENAQTHFHLAELNRQTGSYKDALDNLRAALLIEPKNPRYLDGLFAVSILVKDKVQALDAYKDLKGINPENAKLEEMKKQIDDL